MTSFGFEISLYGLSIDAMGAVVLAKGLLASPRQLAATYYSGGLRIGTDPRIVVERTVDGARARTGLGLLLLGFLFQALGLSQDRPPLGDYAAGWLPPTIAVSALTLAVLFRLRYWWARWWWRRHLPEIAGIFAGNSRANSHEVMGRMNRTEQIDSLRVATAAQLAGFAQALDEWPHPDSFQGDSPEFLSEIERVYGSSWWNRAERSALGPVEATGLLKPASLS